MTFNELSDERSKNAGLSPDKDKVILFIFFIIY